MKLSSICPASFSVLSGTCIVHTGTSMFAEPGRAPRPHGGRRERERESSVDIEGFLFGMPTKWGQAYPAASLLSSALRRWGVRSGSEYSGRCDSAPWGTGRHCGLPGPPCPRGHCCWGLPSGSLLLCQGPWLPGPRDSQELSVSQPWFCRCPCLPTVLAEIGCSPILVFCNNKEFRTETGSSGQPGGKAE